MGHSTVTSQAQRVLANWIQMNLKWHIYHTNREV
jgi:hypothetical protein